MLTLRDSSRRPGWPSRRVKVAAAALLLTAASGAFAGQTSATFKVVVEWVPNKNAAECASITQGNAISVTCTPIGGRPSPAQNQLLYVFQQNNQWLGTVESMMTTGTVTSWRVVKGRERDYLELVVGW
ncbi:MAG TPA: hypothetical protein VFK48_18000 [Usitatibacter sp.]|nr:hypothetical protein [Usitatibacter sp.]